MIYFTPYVLNDDGVWEVTAESSESGFESFDDIIQLLGKPVHQSQRYIIYGDDHNRSLYSEMCWARE